MYRSVTMHRVESQTDGQTDVIMMPVTDHIACSTIG